MSKFLYKTKLIRKFVDYRFFIFKFVIASISVLILPLMLFTQTPVVGATTIDLNNNNVNNQGQGIVSQSSLDVTKLDFTVKANPSNGLSILLGSRITYTLTITNGMDTAITDTNILIKNDLTNWPNRVTLITATSNLITRGLIESSSESQIKVRMSDPGLESGDSFNVVVVVDTKPSSDSNRQLIYEPYIGETPKKQANEITHNIVDLTTKVSGPPIARVGELITFTVTANYLDNHSLEQVKVKFKIPYYTNPASSNLFVPGYKSGTDYIYDAGSRTITFSYSSLSSDLASGAKKESWTVVVMTDDTFPANLKYLTGTATIEDKWGAGTPYTNYEQTKTEAFANITLNLTNQQYANPGPPTVSAEQILVITNSGDRDATNILIDDILPSNVSQQSAIDCGLNGKDGGYSDGHLTPSAFELKAKGKETITCIIQINVLSPVNAGIESMTNKINVTYQKDPFSTLTSFGPVTTDLDSSLINYKPNVAVGITKSPDSAAVNPGDYVSCNLVTSNNGTQHASGVELSIQMADNTLIDNIKPQPDANGKIKWSIDNLQVGQTPPNLVSFRIRPELARKGQLVRNTVTLKDNDGTKPTSFCDFFVGTVPELAVTQSLLNPVGADDEYTYNIQVINQGTAVAVNTVVIDTLPTEVTVLEALEGKINGNQVTWNIGNLAVNGVKNLAVKVKVKSALPANISKIYNYVTATEESNTDPIPDNNKNQKFSVDIIPQPDVAVILFTDNVATIRPSGLLAFMLHVKNNGNQDLEGVLVEVILPEHTIYVWDSAIPTEQSYITATRKLVFPLANLLTNDTKIYQFNSQVASSVDNTMSVTATVFVTHASDISPANNVLTDVTTIVSSVDLVITKTTQQATVQAGKEITYQLVVSNIGDRNAQGVTVIDTFPEHTSYLRHSGIGSFIGTTDKQATWFISELGGGKTVTGTVTLIVADIAPNGKMITNTALVTLADAATTDPDPTPSNNLSTATSRIINSQTHDLAVTLSYVSDVGDAEKELRSGNNLTYLVIISNEGELPAFNVVAAFTNPHIINCEVSEIQRSRQMRGKETCNFTWPTLPISKLDKNQKLIYRIDAKVADPVNVKTLIDGKIMVATVTVSASSNETNLRNNVATYTNKISTEYSFAISQRSSHAETDFVWPGDLITYTLMVTNTGSKVAENITILDELPAATTLFDKGTSEPIGNSNITLWQNINLAVKETKTFSIVVQVTPSQEETIRNTVTVKHEGISYKAEVATNYRPITPTVKIEGPLKVITSAALGDMGGIAMFTAIITPVSAVQPIVKYEWQASDNGQISKPDLISTDIQWQTLGYKTITVTATTKSGIVITDIHRLEVVEGFICELKPDVNSDCSHFEGSKPRFEITYSKGTVTQSINLIYIHRDKVITRPGYVSVGEFFDLEAYHDYSKLDSFKFLKPITLGIYYRETISPDLKSSLRLLYQAGESWPDVLQDSCQTNYNHTENKLGVGICHLTSFGLFAPGNGCPNQPDNSVCVLDENNRPVTKTPIYQNGQHIGETNNDGVLTATNKLTSQDKLVAMKLVYTQPTNKLAHALDNNEGNFAFKVYQTNLPIEEDGNNPQLAQSLINEEHNQYQLTVNTANTLILFNIAVSLEWDDDASTDGYLLDLRNAFKSASDYLYDVSNGQMAFGWVTFYEQAENWDDADYRFLISNKAKLSVDKVGGLTDRFSAITVGRAWDRYDGSSGQSWSKPDGYHTLIRLFGNYALHLYNEDEIAVFDNGEFKEMKAASCPSPDIKQNNKTATNPGMMYWQYNATELADNHIDYGWTDNCKETEQYRINQESDWQTVRRYYHMDNWTVTTPISRGRVIAGPDNYPKDILPALKLNSDKFDASNPSKRTITVKYGNNNPVPGAIVRLYPSYLNQGLTNENGKIDIYGAADKMYVVAKYPGYCGYREMLPGTNDYSITLDKSKIQATANEQPYLRLIPQPAGAGFAVEMVDATLSDNETWLVSINAVAKGGYSKIITMSTTTASNTYRATFPQPTYSAGRLQAYRQTITTTKQSRESESDILARMGCEPSGEITTVSFEPSTDTPIQSQDGNFQLFLPKGSVTTNRVDAIIFHVSDYPNLGNRALIDHTIYQITMVDDNTTIKTLKKRARLILKPYSTTDVEVEKPNIYIWQEKENLQNWNSVEGSAPTLDKKAMSATILDLGTYALLKDLPTPTPQKQLFLFLPLVFAK